MGSLPPMLSRTNLRYFIVIAVVASLGFAATASAGKVKEIKSPSTLKPDDEIKAIDGKAVVTGSVNSAEAPCIPGRTVKFTINTTTGVHTFGTARTRADGTWRISHDLEDLGTWGESKGLKITLKKRKVKVKRKLYRCGADSFATGAPA